MDAVASRVELFGAAACPYTSELREHLAWQQIAFTEYDVERDPEARARMLVLTGGRLEVPVLVRDGCVAEIGWRGRCCYVGAGGACT
jgi:glutaredoxin